MFKNYRAVSPAPVIEQSDATYQLWQGFRVQQEANAGNAVSQFELSIRYLTGRGFKSDTAKAVYWTEKAAEQNHLLARYNLGIFQHNGWGTEWNPFAAYRNFRLAAERNVPEAQFVLAQFLTENLIVPQDWNEAYRWTKLAADSGYVPAQEALKLFAQRGFRTESSPDSPQTPPQKSLQPILQLSFLDFGTDTLQSTPDSILVDDLMRFVPIESMASVSNQLRLSRDGIEMNTAQAEAVLRAADAGSPEALTLMGRCHEQGLSCKRDPVLAAMYYVRAIRLESRRATRLLHHLLQDNNVFALLKTRVAQNDSTARYVWPCLVALGFDRQLTDAQALQMLERSAASGYSPALVELGLAYYSGRWVQRSEEKALEMWEKAAQRGSTDARLRTAILHVRSGKADIRDALQVLEEASLKGSVLAEFALAYCYETGRGVTQKKAEAVRLYRTSAQRGSQDAYRSLLRMHDEIRPTESKFRIQH